MSSSPGAWGAFLLGDQAAAGWLATPGASISDSPCECEVPVGGARVTSYSLRRARTVPVTMSPQHSGPGVSWLQPNKRMFNDFLCVSKSASSGYDLHTIKVPKFKCAIQ